MLNLNDMLLQFLETLLSKGFSMKKKILISLIISFQAMFFLWVTGCGKTSLPSTSQSTTHATIHVLDYNGCSFNSCYGPPWYTTASLNAGCPCTVCSIPDSAVETQCPTAAAYQLETETATMPPSTPTNTPVPSNTIVPTNTPVFTVTPLPSATDVPTPDYVACAACSEHLHEKLAQISLSEYAGYGAIAATCLFVCADSAEVCFLPCCETAERVLKLNTAKEILDAKNEFNECENEYNCP